MNNRQSENSSGHAPDLVSSRWMSLINEEWRGAASIAGTFGYTFYAVLDLSRKTGGNVRPIILQNNLSEELLGAILNSGELLGQCSVFDKLKTTIRPFAWNTGYNAITGEKNVPGEYPVDDVFDAMLNKAGVDCGYTIPVVSRKGRHYVIFYLGKGVEIGGGEADLYLKSIRSFEELSGNNFLPGEEKGLLTNIELHFLTLVAKGYTNDEISKEMKLGHLTLSKLADNILEKSGSATLPQAVIRLYVSGDICC